MRRLGKNRLRNALLVRAQSEDAELVKPCGNGIALPVGQMLDRSQVDLEPTALPLHTRPDGQSENLAGKIGNSLRKLVLVRRVLDRVPRERAAVSNQVT